MGKLLSSAYCCLVLLLAVTPANAQDAAKPAASVPAPVAPAAPPIPNAAPIDPARLAAATKTAALLLPDGAYGRVMEKTFTEMMPQMMGGAIGGMKLGAMGGAEPGSEETLEEALAKSDPNYKERMTISMRVMGEEMLPMMRKLEPLMRAGMAKSFARKFTVAQLNDMNVFFNSPSGKAYAENYMLLMVDKEMMSAAVELMPELMTAMPDIMEKMEKATAHLPKPIEVADATLSTDSVPECILDDDSSDCTPEERAKAEAFYKSIGIDLAAQEKAQAEEKAAVAKAEAQEKADRAAWSAKDRALVEKMEKAVVAQAAKSDAAATLYMDASEKLDEAVAKARSNAGQPAMGATAAAADAMRDAARAGAEAAKEEMKK
jgi:hypothetical protein